MAMNREFVRAKLADSWRAKDPKLMRKQLLMGSFFLTDEDKRKIEKAILDLEQIPQSVRDAARILGGTIISK